jgi:hypothetical protein
MQGIDTHVARPQDRVSGSAHGAYLWTISHMWRHTVRRFRQENTTTIPRTVWGLLLIFGTDAGVHWHGDNTEQFVTRATWGMTALRAIQAATANRCRGAGPLK